MENELKHHGVKGQKWGVRRYQNADGSLTSAGKKRYTQGSGKADKPESGRAANATKKTVDFVKKTAAAGAEKVKAKRQAAAEKKEAEAALAKKRAEIEAIRNRPASELTDDELRARINRMAMENQYNQLNSQLHPQKSNGVKEAVTEVVKNSLKSSGQQLLTQTLNHYGSQGLNALIKEVNNTKIAETKLELTKAMQKSDKAHREADAAKVNSDRLEKAYKTIKKDESASDEDRDAVKAEYEKALSTYRDKRQEATIASNEKEVAVAKAEAAKKPEEVIFANNKKK